MKMSLKFCEGVKRGRRQTVDGRFAEGLRQRN